MFTIDRIKVLVDKMAENKNIKEYSDYLLLVEDILLKYDNKEYKPFTEVKKECIRIIEESK